MEELKPCPLCGGTPMLSEGPYDWDCGGRYYYSAAIECACGLTFEVDNPGPKVYTSDAEALNFVVDAWNTRAERTCKLTAPVSDIGWCSECNAPINKLDLPNYCPNCGARGPEAISDAKARAAWIARADGCKVAGVYDYGDRDQYRVYALSCGHAFEWNDDKPPAYCPECGAKVVSE